jgi:hypothetical protein
MDDEWGGLVLFLLMVLSAIVGTQLPAPPPPEKSTDALLAEVVRRVGEEV